MSTTELEIISNARKEVLYFNQSSALGELIFTQRWWLDPHTRLGTHLHEGMDEVISLVRGSARMLVWLEEGREIHVHDLEPGGVVFVPTGCRHAIINATENEAELTATGFKTRESGQTIRFE